MSRISDLLKANTADTLQRKLFEAVDAELATTNTAVNGKAEQPAEAEAAPTTSTVGKVGDMKIYSSKLYVCTAVSGSTYTWKYVSLT